MEQYGLVILILIAFVAVQCCMIKIMRRIFTMRVSIPVMFCIVSCVSIFFLWITLLLDNLPAMFVCAFLIGTCMHSIIFRLSLMQAYFCSCCYVFHLLVFSGCSIGMLSLISQQNSFVLLSHLMWRELAIIVTMVLMATMAMVYLRHIDRKRYLCFFHSKLQLRSVLICHLAITVFLLFNTFNYYYNLDLVWISIAQVLIGLLLYLVYIVILNYGMRIAYILQYDLRSQQYLELTNEHLRHQNTLSHIGDILYAFKHDYREQMMSIEHYLVQGNYEQIYPLLETTPLQQLNQIPSMVKYCNDPLLNSLFIACSQMCQEKKIALDALLYFPMDTKITVRALHDVLWVLLKNAIEASEQVSDDRRFVSVKSKVDDLWLTISISNGFHGTIVTEDDRPINENPDQEHSGMSLIYAEQVLEQHESMCSYHIDHTQGVCNIIILIPLQQVKEG